MIKVLLDTSPLENANSTRGVGMYTRFLAEHLEKLKEITLKKTYEANLREFKPDIVHFPFFDLFFSTLPLRRGVKTVVTVHDVIPLIFPDQYRPGKKGTLRFIKQKMALKKADAVITDSESSKIDISKFLKIPDQKIHVVPLAANPFLRFADEKSINSAKRKLNLPKNYILYVGDINYNKNLPQLIKAMKYLPQTIKLVCVGNNFAPQEIDEWKAIETQMALSDVANRIKFYTNIAKDDYVTLSAIYSGALCYVQPSLYEGFGLPVLEAMQCKTPVISSANSSLFEVGGNHALFVREKAENIAEAVEKILNWTDLERQEHINNAYKWSQNYSWKKTATQTAEVYKTLIKS